MVKKAILGLFLSILAPIFAYGASQAIAVGQFSGLDTQDNPASLQPSQSQDLLNVRLQPQGRAVYKRDGYGLFQALNAISTATVHGAYHFQQTGGADVQLWGSDAGLYASVNDTAFVRVATGTVNATWQCTDNLGYAYCVTSANDTPVKTDGTIVNTTYQGSIPAGSIIASTPLQLIVAGVLGNISSVYVSANNNFTNFTTGPLPTDPYTEIINAPGSRITNLGFYFGNLYWWKDQSMGYISGSASQGTVGITIVSNQIGTLDDSLAFWNPTNYDLGNKFNSMSGPTSSGNPYFGEMQQLGGIFFRGQDNHIYQYDGYTLTRLSRIISPNVTASSRKKANSWTQTTGADWNNGVGVPAVNISTTISVGDVTVSSFGITESSMQFVNGTFNNTYISGLSIMLSTNNINISNYNFETGCPTSESNWSGPPLCGISPGPTNNCTITARSGTYMLNMGNSSGSGVPSITTTLQDCNSSSVLQTTTVNWASNSCSWTARTLSQSGNSGRLVKISFSGPLYTTISDCFISNGNDITFYTASDLSLGNHNFNIDDVLNGKSSITSGSFTSKVYDTQFTSSTFQISSFTYSANTSTPTFSLATSTSIGGPFVSLLVSTGTNSVGNRYAQYSSTISITASDNALTTISTVTVISESTGTYYSAVDNAPNLTSWNTMEITDTLVGNSSITYYSRASTNSFTVTSSTPSWVLQSKNSTVSASTGTYMQLRADFSITAATETPTLNDFTFNWFEGSASDKAYIQYFQDAILFSVSSGSSTSTNNTIFYLDLLNNTWLRDNIAADGLLVENNSLYIGDPVSHNIYKFGGVPTDNGQTIQSYWKSMDFAGGDPTVQNDWDQADFSFGASSTTVTYTYTIDQNPSLSFPVGISLYSPTSSIIKRGLNLDRRALGTYYNFEIGDNSSSPSWMLLGQKTTYIPQPWRPQVSN